MKASALVILFLLGGLVIAGCGGGGGGGGLVVGSITGPATVNENATANYSVSPSGDSGYTYQWTVSPAGAGTFTNATSATTTFSPNVVAADTAATISVSVTSASYGPVVATLAITIVDVPGIAVGSITGPATVSESATANYSISPSGDSGYTYQWTVSPGTTGTITNGTTATATFNPNPVGADTPATIQVEVNSTNFGPVNATLNITILDDVGAGTGWAATWGGGSNDHARDVLVGNSGDIFTTGYFSGGPVDFDPGPGVDNHWSNAGSDDPFVSKFDSDGNFEWVLIWGGGLADWGYGVAEDSSGGLYVVGTFIGANVNFDPAGWVPVTAACLQDAFLVKFDSDGNFEWVLTWASTNALGLVSAQAVNIDSSDNIYVSGAYSMDTDFDPSAGFDIHTGIGVTDIYVSKFDPTGHHQWTAVWGSTLADFTNGMDINAAGDVWVIGWVSGTCDFDPGAGNTSYPIEGLTDISINHLDTNGAFQWARVWGGLAADTPLGVTVDSADNSYITGWFVDTVDFDPGAGSTSHTSDTGSPDAFLSIFDSGGNFQDVLVWGGPNADYSAGVGVDASGNIFVNGTIFDTVDLDPGAGVDLHTPAGGGFVDIFISGFDSALNYQWGRDWGAAGVVDVPMGLDLDASGNILTCGWFEGTIDFDPGIGVDSHPVAGGFDCWLMKLLPNGDW